MRNHTCLLAAAIIVSCFSALPAEAAAPAAPPSAKAAPTAVYRADGGATIWKHAAALRMDYVYGKVGRRSALPRATVKYAWDDHYLYIGYEVFDANLIAAGSGAKQGPADNRREGCEIRVEGKNVDVVEFVLSTGDESFFWELHHNAADQFNDIWCTVFPKDHPIYRTTMSSWGLHFGAQEFLQDEGPYKLATAVRLKPKADGKPSTVNDSRDVDTGYTAEIRVPWAAVGAPRDRATWLDAETGKPANANTKKRAPGPWKIKGLVLPMLAVVQNGDLEGRYHHSSPTFPGGWFHMGASTWPRYVLTDAPERPAGK